MSGTRFIAIDPGTTQSAGVVWQDGELVDRLLEDNSRVRQWLEEQPHNAEQPVSFVFEKVSSYGMPVGESIFQTCFWTGIFIEKTSHKRAPIYLVPRTTIKKLLKARNDSGVRRRLIERFGEPGTKANPGFTYGLKKDLWQAFGLAVVTEELLQRDELRQFQFQFYAGAA